MAQYRLPYQVFNIFRFDESVDSGGGFKHKSVLAMPIKYSASPGRVMGVFQLVNKVRTVST